MWYKVTVLIVEINETTQLLILCVLFMKHQWHFEKFSKLFFCYKTKNVFKVAANFINTVYQGMRIFRKKREFLLGQNVCNFLPFQKVLDFFQIFCFFVKSYYHACVPHKFCSISNICCEKLFLMFPQPHRKSMPSKLKWWSDASMHVVCYYMYM